MFHCLFPLHVITYICHRLMCNGAWRSRGYCMWAHDVQRHQQFCLCKPYFHSVPNLIFISIFPLKLQASSDTLSSVHVCEPESVLRSAKRSVDLWLRRGAFQTPLSCFYICLGRKKKKIARGDKQTHLTHRKQMLGDEEEEWSEGTSSPSNDSHLPCSIL